jgi:hypothetical protein
MTRIVKPLLTYLALACVCASMATVAHADEIQKSGREEWPSKHELQPLLGYQVGFGGQTSSLYGVKLGVEYAYRFQQYAWFDMQVHNIFGAGPTGGYCYKSFTSHCYYGGWGFEADVGVKMKIPLAQIPLVIEVPILLGVVGMYNRECGDNGASVPIFKTGVGIRYFVTKRIGVGVTTHLAFGPAFHGGGHFLCGKGTDSYTDFYGAFDFQFGGEFLL